MNAIRQILWLTQKDLILQFRTKDTLALIFMFSLLVVLVFSFAVGPVFPLDLEERSKLAASVLWVAFVFAGIIALTRSFDIERANGAIHIIRLAGIDPSNFYLSKVLSNFIFLTILAFILTPVSLQFVESLNSVSVMTLFKLLGILSIGTLGLCAVGVILSGMASTTGGKESLLSVLLLPLVLPVIMAGTKCTVSLLLTESLRGTFWITLLILYSIVFLTISYLLFEFVIEG
ncbi:MAG: heme exporter protein CcmB [Candidatus Poribacteria bacterium]|jgi:heme exporter protein B|nr:heme ABC transporter permease [Candidatus Poribacteria bacterium]